MRKLLFPLAVVLLLALAAAFALLKHRSVRQVQAAELLPPDTVLLAELPNLARTAERWSHTALQELWQEPDLQAFLEQPRAKLPGLSGSDAWPELLADIRPQQAFVALASFQAESPRFVAGFSYLGSQSAAERALEEPRTQYKASYPTGKAELVSDAGVEIQTYIDGPNVLAECFLANWYFVANDVELLKATIARYQAKPGQAQPSLAESDVFKKARTPLPADPELSLFVQPQIFVQRVQSLVKASGQLDSAVAALDSLAKVRGFAAASKIEGPDFHDTWFVYRDEPEPPSKLERHGLALTTASTSVFYSAALGQNLGAVGDLAAQQPMLALLPGFSALQSPGIDLPKLLGALGQEYSLVLEWPPNDLPAPGIALDVREPQPWHDALEKFTQAEAADEKWTRTDIAGSAVYQPPAAGFMLPALVPAIGVGEHFLTLTFGNHALASRAQKPAEPAQTLAQSPAYQGATAAVGEPTEAFGYLNTAAVMERAYSTLRPVLAMSIAFNPAVSPYVDAGKLPSAELLAKHLGATAYSQRATPTGILCESKGPITYDQALVTVAAIYGVAVLPMAKQMIDGGALTKGVLPPVPSRPPSVSPAQQPAGAAEPASPQTKPLESSAPVRGEKPDDGARRQDAISQ